MAEKTDGGQAFPIPAVPGPNGYDAEAGMTLRDYFAAKVLQGVCSHADTWGLPNDKLVEQAYLLADLMLKERNK